MKSDSQKSGYGKDLDASKEISKGLTASPIATAWKSASKSSAVLSADPHFDRFSARRFWWARMAAARTSGDPTASPGVTFRVGTLERRSRTNFRNSLETAETRASSLFCNRPRIVTCEEVLVAI